jgi:hypothetical protein
VIPIIESQPSTSLDQNLDSQPSVVAKILKQTSSTHRAADMWLRETSIYSKLSSGKIATIVRLLGYDARLHSLYIEDIAAKSLAHLDWRQEDHQFSGNPDDAERILRGYGFST